MFPGVFSQIAVGNLQVYKNLSIFPLLSTKPGLPDYLTLDEALDQGIVLISEISTAGVVPELRLENPSEWPVLLVDGEELVGAKQNRVLNLSILAPAKSTIQIAVSCVERGRWSYAGTTFGSQGGALYAAGRARRAGHVTESMREAGTRRSRQDEVWQDIQDKSARMQSHSATEAMNKLYADHAEQIESYVQAFQPSDSQVGAIFSINGQVRGIDLFDYPATLRKLYPKLIRIMPWMR